SAAIPLRISSTLNLSLTDPPLVSDTADASPGSAPCLGRGPGRDARGTAAGSAPPGPSAGGSDDMARTGPKRRGQEPIIAGESIGGLSREGDELPVGVKTV